MAIRLDPDGRRFALELEDACLVWGLHPLDGRPVLASPPAAAEVVELRRRTVLRSVVAPADERAMAFEIAGAGSGPDRPRRLVVELMTNQWNALVLGDADRILAALWRRQAGGRVLRPGEVYVPAAASDRAGRDRPVSVEEWHALLAEVPAAERSRRLVSAVAWTSPLNAGPILGAAGKLDSPDATADSDPDAAGDDAAALFAAYRRYAALAELPAPSPRLLVRGDDLQPYPLPLPGVSGDAFPSLLDAVAAAATGEAASGTPPAGAGAPPSPRVPPELLDQLRRRAAHLAGRLRGLHQELEEAGPQAATLRQQGDLLLSQLHQVRKGMDRVELPDFAGGTVQIELDPALAPTDNAERLYAAAKKRERAASRLPALIERAGAEHDRLAALLDRAERGDAELEEVEAAAGERAAEARAAAKKRAEGALLPYRRYRTSGGFEVRVGRNRKANDELTFHHASPNDIWLHARDVGGSHVVLRWPDRDANPPGRDLQEAAVLAAMHSKARTSGTVAVDWTRRKYVRKPRKAPPGLVTIERAKTLFVEPDAELERRLRESAGAVAPAMRQGGEPKSGD